MEEIRLRKVKGLDGHQPVRSRTLNQYPSLLITHPAAKNHINYNSISIFVENPKPSAVGLVILIFLFS